MAYIVYPVVVESPPRLRLLDGLSPVSRWTPSALTVFVAPTWTGVAVASPVASASQLRPDHARRLGPPRDGRGI